MQSKLHFQGAPAFGQGRQRILEVLAHGGLYADEIARLGWMSVNNVIICLTKLRTMGKVERSTDPTTNKYVYSLLDANDRL